MEMPPLNLHSLISGVVNFKEIDITLNIYSTYFGKSNPF